MRYVSQREAGDIAVAALSMATGHEPDAIRTTFGDRFKSAQSLNSWHFEEWCFRHGIAWQRIHARHQMGGHNQLRAPWPPEPWAPSHLCQVIAAGCFHLVAMDERGVVFDPTDSDRRQLAHADYTEICFVMGLWQVGEPA